MYTIKHDVIWYKKYLICENWNEGVETILIAIVLSRLFSEIEIDRENERDIHTSLLSLINKNSTLL